MPDHPTAKQNLGSSFVVSAEKKPEQSFGASSGQSSRHPRIASAGQSSGQPRIASVGQSSEQPRVASTKQKRRQSFSVSAKLENAVREGSKYLHASSEVLSEALWPTRCALCDCYGSLLCDSCRLGLPYIDFWQACPHCGAPFGKIQCSECNPVILKALGEKRLPFTAHTSVVSFDAASARLVTIYKDGNEQRLGLLMAHLLAKTIPPTWYAGPNPPVVSFIPATKKAFQRRGFDHAELLAKHLAEIIELPFCSLFKRPASKDQRSLSRRERIENMANRFTLDCAHIPSSVLLVDDVYTTGSTLCSATNTLLEAGCESVYCATFARVW